jgi:hypothetical protein
MKLVPSFSIEKTSIAAQLRCMRIEKLGSSNKNCDRITRKSEMLHNNETIYVADCIQYTIQNGTLHCSRLMS